MKSICQGRLPNLIVIGAMKCATTSLHSYLGLHPDIQMSEPKELRFFADEQNWCKGLDWYTAHFREEVKVYGETSPCYTLFPLFPDVPECIFSIIPDAKLLYIVRDPVKRLISHYFNHYVGRKIHQPLSVPLTDLEENPLVCAGQYFMQLERYLAYFSATNILVITTEALHNNRQDTLRRIFEFLEVDASFFSLKFSFAWNQSKYKRVQTEFGRRLEQAPLFKLIDHLPFEMRGAIRKILFFPLSRKLSAPVLDETTRQRVMEFLQNDVNRLRAYTGNRFEEWCV